jgi:transcriptional regulator with XRE-family HTH domain
VIANLENGRRETISVAEMLVIAAALDVPPVLLIADVGREESTEILPGVESSSWLARGWILGAADPVRYSPQDSHRWRDARRAIILYDIHKILVREHQQMRIRLKRLKDSIDARDLGDELGLAIEGPEDPMLAEARSELAYKLDRIRSHRDQIQKEGFVLPGLPTEISSALRLANPVGRHQAGNALESREETDEAPRPSTATSVERPVVFDRLTEALDDRQNEGNND